MASPERAAVTGGSTLPFRLAAALGFSGVLLGAFGAHLLKPTLAAFGTADIWQTAVTYQLIHAVALLALAVAGRAGWVVTWLWTGGVVVFSGALYIIATSELKWLGAIAPIGGLALLAGWLWLLIRGR